MGEILTVYKVYTKVRLKLLRLIFVQAYSVLCQATFNITMTFGSLTIKRDQKEHISLKIRCVVSVCMEQYRQILKAGYNTYRKVCENVQKCKKRNVYSGVFHFTLSAFCTSFLAFYTKVGICVKSQRISLMKHEIWMKCEKCMVSVSYFLECIAKTLAKYSRNAKHDKCIADQIEKSKKKFLVICSVGIIFIFPQSSSSQRTLTRNGLILRHIFRLFLHEISVAVHLKCLHNDSQFTNFSDILILQSLGPLWNSFAGFLFLFIVVNK